MENNMFFKAKAKRADTGAWIKTNTINEQNYAVLEEIQGNWITMKAFNIIEETISPYSGCTDKNENQIFENDILYDKKHGWHAVCTKSGDKYELQVFHINGYKDGDPFPNVREIDLNDWEIYGNLHDFPELKLVIEKARKERAWQRT